MGSGGAFLFEWSLEPVKGDKMVTPGTQQITSPLSPWCPLVGTGLLPIVEYMERE